MKLVEAGSRRKGSRVTVEGRSHAREATERVKSDSRGRVRKTEKLFHKTG